MASRTGGVVTRVGKRVAGGVRRIASGGSDIVRSFVWLGAAVVLGAAALGMTRIPDVLAEMEAFRATRFAVADARFLGVEEALRWARIPAGASVWDDPAAWEDRLREHPLVEDVEIRRDLPRGLVFQVREKTPVALFPRPILEPVDAEGTPLPVDPSVHRLDLPVIRPAVAGEGRELTADELAGMAREVGRLRTLDPGFVATISDLSVAPRGDVVATLVDPRVELRFRPPLSSLRLQEGMQALAHAAERVGPEGVRAVDLRYDDQVVVRLVGSTSTRRRAD